MRPNCSLFIAAQEEKEWEIPSSAETVPPNQGCLGPSKRHSSMAKGLQMESFTGCKAMKAEV